MNAKEFCDWIEHEVATEEDRENILVLVARLVIDPGLPPMTVARLRDTVRRIYTYRPNRTWDMLMEELKAPTGDKGSRE